MVRISVLVSIAELDWRCELRVVMLIIRPFSTPPAERLSPVHRQRRAKGKASGARPTFVQGRRQVLVDHAEAR